MLFRVCCVVVGLFGLVSAQLKFGGVNLAGAEFGEDVLPGVYDEDYTYPTPAEIDYFIAKGFNTIRIPFRWERVQRQLGLDFDALELSRLLTIVNYATFRGAYVIIDPHNYGRYFGGVVGSDVPAQGFANLWERMSEIFNDNDMVIFGLMNAPHTMPTEQWVESANAAIMAIRGTGAANLILVPGNGRTNANTWTDTTYGTPNSVAMTGILDPLNNYAIEMRQYLDFDFSGNHPECVGDTIGAERLNTATNWARANNVTVLLTEFAGGANDECFRSLNTMLTFMAQNDDVWLGYTWWAAGPWWGEYIFTLEPTDDGEDRPQMVVLAQHLPAP